jgi:hypothetical protein
MLSGSLLPVLPVANSQLVFQPLTWETLVCARLHLPNGPELPIGLIPWPFDKFAVTVQLQGPTRLAKRQ